MTKMKKVVAVGLAVVFTTTCMLGCRVNQTKLNTAKNYTSKAVFYLTVAETLMDAAVAQFPTNQKVVAAVDATAKAVDVVRTTLELVTSGLSKDESLLATKTAELVVAIFALVRAVKDAKKV